jgi:hypothetical protein
MYFAEFNANLVREIGVIWRQYHLLQNNLRQSSGSVLGFSTLMAALLRFFERCSGGCLMCEMAPVKGAKRFAIRRLD